MRTRQLLVNVLTNAIKFTRRSGRIAAQCRDADEMAPEPTLLRGPDGPWVCVDIDDIGIGLDSSQLERMFQPRVQSDVGAGYGRTEAGSGLAIGRDLARGGAAISRC